MTGWAPPGGAGSAGAAADDEQRCGTQRASMRTNVLIAKTPLGKPVKTTFNTSPPDRAYGMPMPADPEGARAVISSWHSSAPNPRARASAGPDFKAMNAAAAAAGLVSSAAFRDFRAGHLITLRAGAEGVSKPPPKLPSDVDPSHTYGRPAGYRSAEEVRACGAEEPPVKALVQGAYAQAWVTMNLARKDEFDAHRKFVPPALTRATAGHALGAALATMAAQSAAGAKQWKMPRFEARARSVVRHIMRPPAPAAEGGHTQG